MSTFRERLDEADRFFMKRGKVHQTMHRIVAALEREGIPYVVLGTMALNAHGYVRVTTNVDFLVTPEGLAEIQRVFAITGKSMQDAETGVKVKFITTGQYPGDGLPKPVRFPDPAEVSIDHEGYKVISLPKLIELKLASGLATAARLRDLADVQDLIIKLDLPRELGEQLDPSVRDGYERLWGNAQNIAWDPSAG